MWYQQVKMYDIENDCYFGGIAECESVDNGEANFKVNKIICACCGGTLEPEDWENEDADFRLCCFYPTWVDFSFTIIEDDEE